MPVPSPRQALQRIRTPSLKNHRHPKHTRGCCATPTSFLQSHRSTRRANQPSQPAVDSDRGCPPNPRRSYPRARKNRVAGATPPRTFASTRPLDPREQIDPCTLWFRDRLRRCQRSSARIHPTPPQFQQLDPWSKHQRGWPTVAWISHALNQIAPTEFHLDQVLELATARQARH